MIVGRLALCFALAAGFACAQGVAQLEIRGTVVEGALGIGGVTVTLYEFGHIPAEATTRSVFATTFTDSAGKFMFHPARSGEYYVDVKKEGYFAESFDGPTVDPADSTGDLVNIDPDHPLREQKFLLMRLGELHGRIVDEDGEPLENLRVGIRPGTVTPVVTDKDGYFTATKLRPGDYIVSVLRRGPEILPQFSEEDLKIVDQDLQVSNWPGVPVPVRSGASLSVGTITARKTPYYRAHLSVQSADCAPGENWTFSPIRETAGFGPTVPCGKEFLVRNLAPGSYTFMLSTGGRPGETRRWASAPVEVTDRNIEITMTMSAGVDISGRVIGAEGVTLPPLAKTMVIVSPVPARLSIGGSKVDPNGNFQYFGPPGGQNQISMLGLADKFYIKEIRYNGVVIADSIITPIAGSPTVLDIVIDDQAAKIGGSIAERDKVTGRIAVVAVKWPVSLEAVSIPSVLITSPSTTADEQGRFQIGGLAPGEYRIFALTEDLRRVLGPEKLTRVLNGAEKVMVERGSSQSISLRVVEP